MTEIEKLADKAVEMAAHAAESYAQGAPAETTQVQAQVATAAAFAYLASAMADDRRDDAENEARRKSLCIGCRYPEATCAGCGKTFEP